MFGWLKPVAVPERVQRLIVEINEGEIGGIDVNHYDASIFQTTAPFRLDGIQMAIEANSLYAEVQAITYPCRMISGDASS